MRWILLTLILVNLGYYIHKVTMDVPAHHSVESTLPRNHSGDEITLLSEASSSSLIELQELVNKPSVQSLADSGKKRCQAIGPFKSIFEGQSVAKQLEALGLKVTTQAVDEASRKSDYRLLIPPLNSIEEAFRKLRELQASKVDGYVITGGPSELGVSMGVFSTREAAVLQQDRVRAIGFEGAIVPIVRTERTYWLFADPGTGLEISKQVWANLESATNSLVKRDFPCE